MTKYLFILRGIPGSGKSTVAKEIAPEMYICTADDFHMKNGEYHWRPENVGKAHAWCQKKTETLMELELSPIVVANTSTTVKEMQPYYDMAKEYGYTVFSIIVENRHDGVNTHGVPEETLQKMRDRFDIKL